MTPTVIPHYLHAPGTCYLCKAAQRRPDEMIVDTGIMVDANIAADPSSPSFNVQYVQEPVVICEACIAELGSIIGMVSTERAEHLSEQIRELVGRCHAATARANDLQHALDALTKIGWAGGDPVEASSEVPPPAAAPDVSPPARRARKVSVSA